MNTRESVSAASLKLDQGERVLWQGQPSQGFRLHPADAFAIPFSLFWLLIVTSIFLIALTEDQGVADPIFWVVFPIFFLFGVYFAVGRFIVDIRTRARTYYVLTNKRALVDTGLYRRVRRVVNLSAVPEISLRSGRRDRGTIMFGNPSPFYAMLPPSWPGSGQMLPPAFDIVEDAQAVYDLALAAQRDSKG